MRRLRALSINSLKHKYIYLLLLIFEIFRFFDHNIGPKYRISFVTGIPLKSIEKLIQASFSVARTIVLVIGVPNQCFPYLNFGGLSSGFFGYLVSMAASYT